MVVVVIPLRVTETSLTMVLAPDEPPPDPLLLPAEEVDCEEPDWDDDAVVDWDDVAVVLDEPMAEIDMESPPEAEIGRQRCVAVCLSLQRRPTVKQA
jgi:hypothetical protein